MPATDSFFHNQRLLHIVFALTSVGLLAATFWMMSADHDDEWRIYVNEFTELEAAMAAKEEAAAKTPRFNQDVEKLRAELKTAEEEVAENAESLQAAKDRVAEAQLIVKNKNQEVRFKRAERDKARADLDLVIARGRPKAEEEAALQIYREEQAAVDVLEREEQNLRQELAVAQKELDQYTRAVTELEAELKKVQADVTRYHETALNLEPDDWFNSAKRSVMHWPIIDGFNSPSKIQQDWLPNLRIKLGMSETARFDRCRTCHLGIDMLQPDGAPKYPFGEITSNKPADWIAQNKFPQPYATHPNPELYCTSASPHPILKFGCTSCHEGQGSGTSFVNAEHGPDNPFQKDQWVEEYGYFANHFWEYPMYPERFREASCIKCHHGMEELGSHPKYGASGAKVFQGYATIQKFGCFGCHEVHGTDAGKPIGPDLRLEGPTLKESHWIARKQIGLLPEAEATAAQKRQIDDMAEKLAADPTAGKLRKVGPALTYVAQKTTEGWLSYWTEAPRRFQPETRMPHFFHLSNQDDEVAAKFQPVELAGIASYLMDNSRQGLDLEKPEEAYQPNAERGKELFARRGCVACHSHDDENFKAIKEDFGPNLTRIAEKVRPGAEGFQWVYSWIKNPTKYHERTKMPNLYLDVYQEKNETVDPAADITAFLLKNQPAESKYQTSQVNADDLDELVRQLLAGKLLTKDQTDEFLETGDLPIARNQLKGDEIELTLPGDKVPSKEEFAGMKLNYVGRKVISRYGCYGCHSIPGFEDARPIGAALQDWGRKETARLAFEHVEEYLHHHGADHGLGYKRQETHEHEGGEGHDHDEHAHESHGESTAHIAAEGLKLIQAGEIPAGEKQEKLLSTAYYYDSILHHGRPGFIWQKLRAPRSYDYKKIETKSWEERLRMPLFQFSADEAEDARLRESIITFVLGLVAEPPTASYIYQAPQQEADRQHGEELLRKYNCKSCHMLDLPEYTFAANVADIVSSAQTREQLMKAAEEGTAAFHPEALELLLTKYKPPRRVDVSRQETIDFFGEKRETRHFTFRGLPSNTPSEEDPIEDRETSFALWETLEVPRDVEFFKQYNDQDFQTGEMYRLLQAVVNSWQHKPLNLLDPGPEFALLLPKSNIFYNVTLDRGMKPAEGGDYAQWLVSHLTSTRAAENRDSAWHMAPPPLMLEGHKVQTQWLYQFLLEPNKIRHTTVLRMPKFNMSPAEAQALANYFAARDNVPYPYQKIEPREPDYVAERTIELKLVGKEQSYLHESWKLLNGQVCIGCHAVGNRPYKASGKPNEVQGPNLEYVRDRLRPEYAKIWIYQPDWILPYTKMVAPYPNGRKTEYPKIFEGDPGDSVIGVRDALMNYYELMERYPNTVYDPKAASGEQAVNPAAGEE